MPEKCAAAHLVLPAHETFASAGSVAPHRPLQSFASSESGLYELEFYVRSQKLRFCTRAQAVPQQTCPLPQEADCPDDLDGGSPRCDAAGASSTATV